MTSVVAFIALAAAAQGAAISNSPPPVLVLPPQSVPPAAMELPALRIVRGPQERGSTQSYFSTDDYPYEARGTGAQGLVRFTLTVDPGGRVVGCAITQSSGSAVLDAATCRIMQRRARYTPAVDNNGNPVTGTIDQQIVWRLPAR